MNVLSVSRLERAQLKPLLTTGAPVLDPTPLKAPTVVVDAATGQPILAVGRYQGDLGALRRAFMAYPMTTTKRAAGIRNRSAVFGSVSRRVHMKREGCRECNGAHEAPGPHQAILDAGAHLAAELDGLVEGRAKTDRAGPAAAIAEDWLIADTAWTSGVLNETSPLPYHYDRNNLPTWSSMVVVRRQVTGGHLHIPEMGLVVECRDGDTVHFPGWQFMHGVTPMARTVPDGYRYTAVFYTVQGMADCLPPGQETARARHARSVREDTLLDRQTASGLRADGRNLEDDLAAFGALQLESRDIDPVYPVLAEIEKGMGREEALHFTLRYVTYYHLGSALRSWAGEPDPLPTGHERRNLRAQPRMAAHRRAVAERIADFGSAQAWLEPASPVPTVARREVRDRYEQAVHNGRWASYKLAEILMVVHGWPILAPDMGNDGSTGPLQGLNLVLGTSMGWNRRDTLQADQAAADLLGRLHDRLPGLRIEQLETLLCDFHAMHDGRYYPGIDIDMMQEQMSALPPEAAQIVAAARSAALPHEWLGELTGRAGIDKARKRAYADTGAILGRP